MITKCNLPATDRRRRGLTTTVGCGLPVLGIGLRSLLGLLDLAEGVLLGASEALGVDAEQDRDPVAGPLGDPGNFHADSLPQREPERTLKTATPSVIASPPAPSRHEALWHASQSD